MNKKILIGCVCIVFMLVAISLVSAMSNEKSYDKKESPLFKIRRDEKFKESVKTSFLIKRDLFELFILQNRLYMKPSSVLKNLKASDTYFCHITEKEMTWTCPTCANTFCDKRCDDYTMAPFCHNNNLRQQLAIKDTMYDYTCKNFYTCFNSYPCAYAQ